ncbi:MAG: FAD-binding protein [Pseudonocardiales bacterium]
MEAGIQWPQLVDQLLAAQRGQRQQWGIAQKQTGANYFTIGGSVSANCHGRGLTMAPMVADVEALRLVRADGSVVHCSREQNAELFRLVVGGYGLFGAIYSVTLRLARRTMLERVVDVITVQQLVDQVPQRISADFRYGDFQFAIDPDSPDFLTRGVFSCYRPVDDDRPIPENQRALGPQDWQSLLVLAHTDKSRAFDLYARHYLATSGQRYWSDLHQLAVYLDDYHHELDHRLGAEQTGTEMISELYVPRKRLPEFMAAAADELRRRDADLIYGTVRFIEPDEETYLAWAREDYACIVFNLHTPHTREGVARTATTFRRLIDLAIERGGSYYLAYHRWADTAQVLTCHPHFADFLNLKRHYDPDELFHSDWVPALRHPVPSGRTNGSRGWGLTPRPLRRLSVRVTPPSVFEPPPGVSRDALFGADTSHGNGQLWVGGLGYGGVIAAHPAEGGSIGQKFG